MDDYLILIHFHILTSKFVFQVYLDKMNELKKTSYWSAFEKIIKLNSPEWLEIAIGCIAAVFTGAAFPVYSIFFGDLIGVS